MTAVELYALSHGLSAEEAQCRVRAGAERAAARAIALRVEMERALRALAQVPDEPRAKP